MSIVGIDYEKCNNCKICSRTCFLFKQDKEQNKITFIGAQDFCNLCGHCIARCPEDAILHEDMGEVITYKGVDKPETIAPYDIIYKFLRANRSVRSYKKKKVPRDILKKVFEAMTHAPTGGNIRSEKFSIISDPVQIKELNDSVVEELLNQPSTGERYKNLLTILGKIFDSPIYFDAPHVIFVESPDDSEIEANNMGIIITYGRLAAQSLGLGTCWNGWTQIAMNYNPKLKEMVNITGKNMGVFIIGYPAVKFYRSPPRTSKSVKGL